MGNILDQSRTNNQQKQLNFNQIMNIIEQRYQKTKQHSNYSENGCQGKLKIQPIYLITKRFKEQTITSQENLTFGCLFGCLIGDALGAYCQFNTRKIDESTLKNAMKMNGGGVFHLRSGQFTDDSQMSYHLLKGLSHLDPDKELKRQEKDLLMKIGGQYVRWQKSFPFDIGNTCKSGIQIIRRNLQGQEEQKIEKILSQVYRMNNKSQSNGSLMRITPMAIFFHLVNEQPQNHKDFIKNQIKLLHPNENLTQAGYIWVVVLYSLIKRKDNQPQTFRKIFEHAQNITENKQIKTWFSRSKESAKMQAVKNMGWAKIAWTYGMNILYRLSSMPSEKNPLQFFQEIKSVIKQAGDSDTNACIVGGIVGAIVGFKKLPKKYLQKLMRLQFPEVNSQKLINDRPKQYEPFNVFVTLVDFIEKCKLYKNNQQNIKQRIVPT